MLLTWVDAGSSGNHDHVAVGRRWNQPILQERPLQLHRGVVEVLENQIAENRRRRRRKRGGGQVESEGGGEVEKGTKWHEAGRGIIVWDGEHEVQRQTGQKELCSYKAANESH